MRGARLRFAAYQEAAGAPNVVADGSPNVATVLVVSHWPGLPVPPGCAGDTSAEMVFRYLDRGADLHGDAEIVTNNHFDQDGLVAVYALTKPEDAAARRPLLEGLASAGDFAVAPDRSSARLSIAVAALARPERSPIGTLPADYGTACAVLYEAGLELLPSWLDDPDRCRDLWADEDAELEAGLRAIESGRVTIAEDPELDLAVVTLPDTGRSKGHRFCERTFDGVHPIALHGATRRTTILTVDLAGGRHRVTCRYEGWVQLATPRVRPRADLRPLADELDAAEPGGTRWVAAPPSDLVPELRTDPQRAASSLAPTDVIAVVTRYLRNAPPAWDPYAPRRWPGGHDATPETPSSGRAGGGRDRGSTAAPSSNSHSLC